MTQKNFIEAHAITEAKKRSVFEKDIEGEPLILGAVYTDVRSTICVRQGCLCSHVQEYNHISKYNFSKAIINRLKHKDFDAVFISSTSEIVPELVEGHGVGPLPQKVFLSRPAVDEERFADRGSELLYMFREWFSCGGVIPTYPKLESQLIRYVEGDTDGRILISQRFEAETEPCVLLSTALTFGSHVKKNKECKDPDAEMRDT